MSSKSFPVALAGLLMLTSTSAAGATSAIAIVDVHKTDNGIEVVGRAVALLDGHIDGEMTISRKGSAGSVSTSQGAGLDLKAGDSGDVARVGVSYAAGDKLQITLTLKKDGITISEATLSAGGEP